MSQVRRAAGRARWGLVTLLAVEIGCVAGGGSAPPRELPPPLQRSEDRAFLLLMSDRRLYEPFTVRRLGTRPREVRVELALTLGRVGDRRGRGTLEGLLSDPAPEVARAAAFALGRLGDPAAAPALLAAAAGPDRDAAILAVASLARLEVPLARAVEALAGLAPHERDARLLRPLFRYPAESIPPLASPALARSPDGERRWAAYALARKTRPESAPRYRELLADPDPWLRGWGARALGQVGGSGDLAALRPLLDDAEPGPAIQALRAARRLIRDGRAAAGADWREGLLRRLEDPHPGVRLTAIETASAWLADGEVAAALVRTGEEGGARAREVALLALAEGGHPDAERLARRAAASPDSSLRACAAEAASILELEQLLQRLAGDREAAVRLALLSVRLEGAGDAGAATARAALLDTDPGVRAAALAWLVEHPLAPLEELGAAMEGPGSRRLVETRLQGVRALVSRARSVGFERGAIVARLEALARDGDHLVRREAAAGLETLDRPRPEIGAVDTGRSVDAYRDLAARAAVDPEVEIVTARGTVRVRLLCSVAPLTCVNFLQLAEHGFFDGLVFHRVVPDFVVQAGDPRGDGWGGPGYTIRDENSPLRYTRGTVGMALSGPDTGGSQFFITLSEQPHLEGDYPAFGRVVAGDEVLDRIVQGDRIDSVRRVTEGSGHAGP